MRPQDLGESGQSGRVESAAEGMHGDCALHEVCPLVRGVSAEDAYRPGNLHAGPRGHSICGSADRAHGRASAEGRHALKHRAHNRRVLGRAHLPGEPGLHLLRDVAGEQSGKRCLVRHSLDATMTACGDRVAAGDQRVAHAAVQATRPRREVDVQGPGFACEACAPPVPRRCIGAPRQGQLIDIGGEDGERAVEVRMWLAIMETNSDGLRGPPNLFSWRIMFVGIGEPGKCRMRAG